MQNGKLYKYLNKEHEVIEKRKKAMKEQKAMTELVECTFAPKINNNYPV